MTKEEFKSIPKIEKAIEYKREQLRELRAMMITIPGLQISEKVQTSTVNKSMKIVDAALDLQDKLHADCIKLLKLKDDAYDLIRTLDGTERLLMELRYINGYKWPKIAEELNYSYRNTTRLHVLILQKLFPENK